MISQIKWMIASVVLAVPAAAQPIYQAELIGGTVNTGSRPSSISSTGVISGDISDGFNTVPAIWLNNSPQIVGTSPGTLAGISGDGAWLAGSLSEPDFSTRAVRMLRGGGFSFLSPVGVSGEALGINAQGVTVGTLGGEAAVWNADGTATTLRLPNGIGGFGAQARTVNDQGLVAGSLLNAAGVRQAFSWTRSGGIVPLPGLGGVESGASAVSSNGWIVGTAELADGNGSTAVVWRNGVVETLGGTSGSQATGVNAAGMIIGSDSGFFASTAWLWQNGQRWTLESLVAAGQLPAGWNIDQALAINDLGDIVVRVVEPVTLDSQYMVLRPVPGPGAATLLVVASGLCARRRR